MCINKEGDSFFYSDPAHGPYPAKVISDLSKMIMETIINVSFIDILMIIQLKGSLNSNSLQLNYRPL